MLNTLLPKNNKTLAIAVGLSLSSAFVGCANTAEYQTPSHIPVGDMNVERLNASFPLFSDGFDAFDASKEQLDLVAKWPDNLNVEVYFGTWCHDSQREVPKFLKLVALQQAQNGKSLSYQLVTLDYNKQEPEMRARNAKVKYTPTFVVKLGDKEIGRIVENTQQSYAHDITQMIAQAKRK